MNGVGIPTIVCANASSPTRKDRRRLQKVGVDATLSGMPSAGFGA